MRPNLITRLKEEWNNLDPVDPLRGLIADAIEALAEESSGTEHPAPPPECQTEAEKTAFAFGWFKALETVREQPAIKQDLTPEQPAQRKPWVGLTEEEMQAAVYDENGCVVDYEDYAPAIEAKLREKNA